MPANASALNLRFQIFVSLTLLEPALSQPFPLLLLYTLKLSCISPKSEPSLKSLEAGIHAKTSSRHPHSSVGLTTGTHLQEEGGQYIYIYIHIYIYPFRQSFFLLLFFGGLSFKWYNKNHTILFSNIKNLSLKNSS